MPTIVGILTFISRRNFMLIWVEHEKSFITSGIIFVILLQDDDQQNDTYCDYIARTWDTGWSGILEIFLLRQRTVVITFRAIAICVLGRLWRETGPCNKKKDKPTTNNHLEYIDIIGYIFKYEKGGAFWYMNAVASFLLSATPQGQDWLP